MNISEFDLKEIASAVGYPAVPLELLELSEDAIKNYSIMPTLRLYYRAFPIVERQALYVTGEFGVPFPDEWVFGVKDARISVAGRTGVKATMNPFINATFIRSSNTKYSTDYRDYNSSLIEMVGAKTAIDTFSAKKIHVDAQNREVTGYSNSQGELIIEWAKYSDDFEDIPFIQKSEVIAVCQGALCEHLNIIRGQAMANQGVDFNDNVFAQKIDRANEIKDKWLNRTKVVILRG